MAIIPPEPSDGKPPSRGPERENFATFDEYAKAVMDYAKAVMDYAKFHQPEATRVEALAESIRAAQETLKSIQDLRENQQVTPEPRRWAIDDVLADLHHENKIRSARFAKKTDEIHELYIETVRRSLKLTPAGVPVPRVGPPPSPAAVRPSPTAPKDAPGAELQPSTTKAAEPGAGPVSMPTGMDDQAPVEIRGAPRASSEPTSLEPYGPLTATEEKAERRKLRDDYGAECRKAGVKVTDEMIARSARKQWRSRYPIQRWLRLDPSVQWADQLIRKVFRDRPHLPKHQQS